MESMERKGSTLQRGNIGMLNSTQKNTSNASTITWERIFRYKISLASNSEFCHSYKSLSRKNAKHIFQNLLNKAYFGDPEKMFGVDFH